MALQDFQADLVMTDYPFAAGEALADLLNLPRAAMTIIVPVSARTASALALTTLLGCAVDVMGRSHGGPQSASLAALCMSLPSGSVTHLLDMGCPMWPHSTPDITQAHAHEAHACHQMTPVRCCMQNSEQLGSIHQ